MYGAVADAVALVGNSARALPALSRCGIVEAESVETLEEPRSARRSPKGGAGMRSISSCQRRSWG